MLVPRKRYLSHGYWNWRRHPGVVCPTPFRVANISISPMPPMSSYWFLPFRPIASPSASFAFVVLVWPRLTALYLCSNQFSPHLQFSYCPPVKAKKKREQCVWVYYHTKIVCCVECCQDIWWLNGNGNANGEIVKQSPMVGNNETIAYGGPQTIQLTSGQ